MDKYCVEDLNHLDDTSVNLFDPKDPTIKNENFFYSETEDLYCKIEENEFIPEDYLPNETVVGKIEVTEHTLEIGTIQELEHIFKDYSENGADEGTETSQISKIRGLDKTDGKKVRKKTKDQKWEVQTNTLDTFLHKARSRVKNRKRTVSDGLFVRLERIDISDKLLANLGNSTSSATSLVLANNENNLGTDQETPKGLNRKSLKHHIKRCHEGVNTLTFQCYHCNKIVKRRTTLITHIRRLHKEGVNETNKIKEYKCHDCNKVLINQKSLKHHIKQCHEEVNTPTFQCYHCNKIVKLRNSLIQHIRWLHKEGVNEIKEYKCHDCNKVLINQKSLKRHIKECHEESNTPFQCYHCNKIVKLRTSLIKHIRRWHKEGAKVFHCVSCTFNTNIPNALVEHVYRSHAPNDQKPSFKCKLCPHETMYKRALEAHVNRVHLRKPITKNSLAPAQRVHDNVKMFECDLCPEESRFRTNHAYNFKWHRVQHLNEDEVVMYTCEYCPYEAKAPRNLDRHFRNHHLKKFKVQSTHSI